MNKKIFIKNRPFDVNDANDMQNWTEDALKKTMASIYSSGIVSGLNVVTKTGMQLTLNTGSAFNSNYDFINVTAAQTLTIGAAHATLGRYDKVVISYLQNTTDNIDTTNVYGMGTSFLYSQNKLDSYTIQVIAGTPASSPTVPATPAGSLALAQIYVGPAASSITTGNITDLRQYISINSNINKPVVIISNTAPTDTTVLWIDTTVNKAKIYVSNAWVILKASDADTLGGNAPSYYSPATHNHDSTYAKIGDAYTKLESDTNFLKKSDNLAALTDKTTARSNLGLGSMATQSSSSYSPSTHNHDGVYTKGDYILTVGTTAPASPTTKDIWWDTTAGIIKRYSGTAWILLNADDANTVGGYSPGTAANNVLKLDSSAKVPNGNLNNASTSGAGIVQLVDNISSTSISQAATGNAVKQVVDWVKSFGLGDIAKTLASGADVNTIDQTGFYYVFSDGVNIPSAHSYWILNMKYSSLHATQLALRNQASTSIIYQRVKNNGTWSAWTQLATTDPATTTAAGIVQLTDSYTSTSTSTAATANSAKMAYDNAVVWAKGFGLGDVAKDISSTDLNNLDVTGFYRGGSLTNSPNSAQTYYVINIKYSSLYKLQIACHIGTNAILTRINNNGTWSAWTQQAQYDTNGKVAVANLPAASTSASGIAQLNDTITSTSTSQAATANAVKQVMDFVKGAGVGDVNALTTGDLNLITKSGMYYANGSANRPIAVNGYLLHQQYSTNYSSQTFFVVTTGDIYQRVNNAGVWGSWIQLAEYDATGKIATANLPSASTTAAGIAQLSDSLADSSTTKAATANAVKQINDSAQMTKLTDNVGGVKLSVSDVTKNFLNEILSLGKGYHTFYCTQGAINNPSTKSVRGIAHFTSATVGWVWCTDYDNNLFTNYYDTGNSQGGWRGWRAIANTDLAQMFKLTQDNGQAQNTSAADANTLTSSGLYTGSLSANAPENDTSAINSLLVSANGNTVTQLSHRRYDNSLFFRSANAGVWTAWKKVATTDVAQMYKLTNDDGSMKIAITFFTDLNIIQTPGQWYISTAQTTNKPSGTTYGLLEVFLNGSTEILQRFTEMGSTSNGRQFFRQYTGTTWTSWVQLATDAINWKTPTLLNGWVNYGGSDEDASYEKTGNRVSLRGTIKSGTTAAGTVLFALPSGYRPAKNFYAMTICSGNNLVRIKVDLNGQVTLNSAPANNTWVQLDNISFVADGN